MKRSVILLAATVSLILSACGGDSSLPVATGKATVRSINAVKTAPSIGFSIEERNVDTLNYMQIGAVNRYDDLIYNFSFNALIAGQADAVRMVTQELDVIKDMEYVFVFTGSVANPSITLWESEDRSFSDGETIFEARFAHTSASMGSLDYYFAPAGVDPVANEEVGTLSFGEILPAVDFEAGDYVLTVTNSGFPDQIVYQSAEVAFAATTRYVISAFDGDATTHAQLIFRAMEMGALSSGASATMPDIAFPPVAELVNGSIAAGTMDIYDDENLMSQVLVGHAYKDVSPEIDLVSGDNPVWYTPTTLMAPVLIETSIGFFDGLRGRVVAYGGVDDYSLRTYVPNRQSAETRAKLLIFNAAVNYAALDLYLLEADAVFEDVSPSRPGLLSGVAPPVLQLAPGSYDLYLTNNGETEIVDGPVRIDVELGDVVDAIIFDSADFDPALVDLEILP